MAEADPQFDKSERTETRSILEQTSVAEGRHAPWRTRALMALVPVLIVAGGAYAYLTSGRTVSTDNAYVKKDIVSVGSDVNGRIVDVRVRENQLVNRGDVLFVIDPEPYRVAVQQADAKLADAQVEVAKLRTDFRTTGVDIEGARADLRFAEQSMARQRALLAQGFTTRASFDEAEHALAIARQTLGNAEADAAKAQAALATGAQVPGVNPAIAEARAERAKAALDLQRTIVRAPVSGRVSQTSRLLVGQMLITGLPALSIVANDHSWIEANFKETDLDKMRTGQRATVTLDAYSGLSLKGHVESMGAGTGSQFSVLPPQNATGNWVKVTQRVPVRIAIDEHSRRPLIAGQSANVTVRFDGGRD